MREGIQIGPRRTIFFLAATLALLAQVVASVAPTSAAEASVSVTQDSAASDFPKGIDFQLTAESRRKIQRIELLYQTADLETLFLSVPKFKPSKRVEITHHLNFLVNYQPSGIDISYRWRFLDDRGAATETEPKTLLWSDNRFDWLTVTSSDITVYAYNQNEAFNRIILDSAQRTVDRLKVQYGVDQVTPIRVWVYNSKKDFAATQQGNSSHWVAGTAYPQLHVILAILPEGNKREVGRVVPHEISHQLLNQATENPFNAPPTWLDEGLAVSIQDTGNEDFQAMVESAAEKGRLFSIRALNSSFPYDAADAALAYAESYSIVRFIVDEFGEEKLGELIAAYRQGVSHDEALRRSLGVGMTELDALWKNGLDYPGDQPRSAGSTRDSSGWADFFGTGLATGALVMIIALLLVGLFGLTSTRRMRHTSPPA